MLDKFGDPTDDRKLAWQALVDSGFLAIARDRVFRRSARKLLIETYFEPEDRAALYKLSAPQRPDVEP
jgi:hypothetical protein